MVKREIGTKFNKKAPKGTEGKAPSVIRNKLMCFGSLCPPLKKNA